MSQKDRRKGRRKGSWGNVTEDFRAMENRTHSWAQQLAMMKSKDYKETNQVLTIKELMPFWNKQIAKLRAEPDK